MPAQVTDREKGYLHTSPEYSMKRLLAFGIGDIYYLGHVFRQGEIGDLHNPEFTMIEWYRAGLTLEALAQEACDLIMLFVGAFPVRSISYRDAFLEFAGVDPFADEDWARAAVQLGLVPPPESKSGPRHLAEPLDQPCRRAESRPRRSERFDQLSLASSALLHRRERRHFRR